MTAAPAFWWRKRPGLAAFALSPIAAIWARQASRRMARLPDFRPPAPVICIGNFVAGGAGKTPTALAIARLAGDADRRPGFVAPGYGGSAAGPLRVDPASQTAALVGDEPLLLAAAAPTVIGRDRAAAARLLLGAGVDLIVMDDGFQNPGLAKDLSIVCVDAAVGIGNGRVIPSGPLRAPLPVQLERTDALLVIGEGDAAAPVVEAAAVRGRPVLYASLVPAPGDWTAAPVLAFAGIGRPRKFFDTLSALGATIAVSRAFADHHPFTDAEATALIAEADRKGLRIVTTEKDLARLAGTTGARAELRARAVALPVVLEFAEPSAVRALLAAAVRRPG